MHLYAASYKVTFSNGRTWTKRVGSIEAEDASAAKRKGRRILKRMFPDSRVRFRRVVRDRKAEERSQS